MFLHNKDLDRKRVFVPHIFLPHKCTDQTDGRVDGQTDGQSDNLCFVCGGII